MTFLAASLLLSLGAGLIDLIGKGVQASANKKQAAKDVTEANKEIVDAKNLATGSFIAQASAAGVGGESVSGALARSQEKYEKQVKQNEEDLSDFIKQTDVNTAFDVTSTIIGTGRNMFSLAYDQGYFSDDYEPIQIKSLFG